jgi:hypothetical protein
MNAEFLSQLQAAVLERKGKPRGKEISFTCPAHDDTRPSASYNIEKHAWHCHVCSAGGGAYSLARLLGVELPERKGSSLTVTELADYVALPEEFLRNLGVSDGINGIQRSRCVDIPYGDEDGEVVAVHKRLRIHGEPRFVWRRGDKAKPYGLPQLADAREVGSLLLVEGDSDTWTAWYLQVPALGLPGASTLGNAFSYIRDIERVYIWHEPDQGGDALVRSVLLSSLPEAFIIQPPPGIKDISALWHDSGHDPEACSARLAELMAQAVPVSQLRQEMLDQRARERQAFIEQLLLDSQLLLEAPNLLDKVADAIRLAGYVGDTTAPQLAYLAVTSRHLQRPLNLAFVAPSAAGKNAAVDAGIALHPEEAFYLVRAGSPKALIYADESFEHRTVIVAEVDSIPQDDGAAASAVRSLAEDNEMTYDVVQEGVTVRITKRGPTGLITTSTKQVGEQLATRMLSVSINDTPPQTREVVKAHAATAAGVRVEGDMSPFIALQRWLDLGGDHEVVVPYASQLAEMVPVDHIRMRRDFRQLMTVIESTALLYQRQRERDALGRVLANFIDYGLARELVLPTFATASSGGVTVQVRETVDMLCKLHVETGQPVTVKVLADALGLTTSPTWYRVQRAIELRYIVNQETRPRQPAKLVPGDPLPEDRPPLPTVSELIHVCEDPGPYPEEPGNAETQASPFLRFSEYRDEAPTPDTHIQSEPCYRCGDASDRYDGELRPVCAVCAFELSEQAAPVKRGRGRPKGSKNKPKVPEPPKDTAAIDYRQGFCQARGKNCKGGERRIRLYLDTPVCDHCWRARRRLVVRK